MSRGLFTTDERKKLLDKLYGMICAVTAGGKECDTRKLIASFSFETGVSEKKIIEYLKVLEDSERVINTGKGYVKG